jgi:hypothetical protein
MAAQITRQNHYVPIWYQRRFTPDGVPSMFYLDSDPRTFVLPDRRVIVGKNVTPRSPKSCFWSEDLYTTRFGGRLNDEVERKLFGVIDNKGARAFTAFSSGDMRAMHDNFHSFFEYLSAQKLRTPKGLDWIKAQYPSLTQLDLMLEMQSLRGMFCTLWLESAREVVSAEKSDVKFILTDHPVTAYNRDYPPGAAACRYPHDPSIGLNGTQSLCPLDADHCLIMTNVAFAKTPDRVNPKETRENARYAGQTISRTDALIRTRHLGRDEVICVNYILKTRARQFIAASNKEWLFPEEHESRPWREIGKVLLPPSNELWHFGGEIIIGHTDGSSQFQDEHGRNHSHEHLRKTSSSSRLKPNNFCGCGSGRPYKKCCSGVPHDERPPWDLFSIRERNLMFANAVLNILGLNKGKTWDDVRRDMSDEQVRQIHEVLGALWPRDTNVAQLLPRPDNRVSRAIFAGIIDPRTVGATVIGWLIYFDEIVFLNPFINPSYVRPEYSPIDSPGQHKAQTLRNVMLLLNVMPFIDAGVLHMVPDPSDVNADFRTVMWDMASARSEMRKPDQKGFEDVRKLAEDDFKRSLFRLSDSSLKRMIEDFRPNLDGISADDVVEYMKSLQEKDPLALLQPINPDGELQMTRGISLEVALFIAQLTGSAIYTDLDEYWQQLQAHAMAAGTMPDPRCAPIVEGLRTVSLTVDGDPNTIRQLRWSDQWEATRDAMRRAFNATRQLGEAPIQRAIMEKLARDVQQSAHKMKSSWRDLEASSQYLSQMRYHIHSSFPRGGFWHRTVQRLLITFGRPKYDSTVWLAMRIKRDDS